MKISIDLDCTLWHYQVFFKALMTAMQKDGHEVGILTSHKIIHEQADLALLEKRGFPAPDFYLGRPVHGPRKHLHRLKAAAILAYDIDMHFDDGDAEALRAALGGDAHRVISVMARGGEEEHYE